MTLLALLSPSALSAPCFFVPLCPACGGQAHLRRVNFVVAEAVAVRYSVFGSGRQPYGVASILLSAIGSGKRDDARGRDGVAHPVSPHRSFPTRAFNAELARHRRVRRGRRDKLSCLLRDLRDLCGEITRTSGRRPTNDRSDGDMYRKPRPPLRKRSDTCPPTKKPRPFGGIPGILPQAACKRHGPIRRPAFAEAMTGKSHRLHRWSGW